MSIELKNITKEYGTQKAVDNASFSIKKGEIVGFLGPNGAGKTTTMKMITSFIPSSEGEAVVCGFNVNENPREVRKRIGYLPEHNPLYKDMYVREYLRYTAGLHHLSNSKQRIEEVIQMTGLQKEANKKIGSLSKGYRQRVGLAQAIIHDPEVLILDEPTTGLDPNQLLEIRELIRNLGKEKTVLFSSHIMQEVQALCDRVIIINNGQIVADDSIDVLTHLKDEEIVLNVEFNKNVKSEAILKIPGIKEIKDTSGTKFELVATKKDDPRVALFNFAVENKLVLLELKKDDFGIEDVFQKLTKGE